MLHALINSADCFGVPYYPVITQRFVFDYLLSTFVRPEAMTKLWGTEVTP
jgi:hypothetical protein